MIQVHYPPAYPFINHEGVKVFLAGTIDMGLSIDWQAKVIEYLSEKFRGSDVAIDIFNPRRKDWDSTWGQDHPMLTRQIEWELCFQEQADVIIMVLLENSKSPISLLELGSFKNKPILVLNPRGFYRFRNVEVFCKMNQIYTCQDWDDFLIYVRRYIDGQVLTHKDR